MPAEVNPFRALSHKTCGSCGVEKSLEEFPRDRTRKDGRHSYCRRCKARRQRERAHQRTIQKHEAPERRCSVCRELRPAEEFASPRAWKCSRCKNETAAAAKAARRGKSQAWYRANKERKRLHLALQRDLRKQQLVDLRGGQCVDCGLTPSEEWPIGCFDFHHESDDKEHSIARLTHSAQKWDLAVAEAEKCVVVCSNCHRRRHWNQKRKEMHDEC